MTTVVALVTSMASAAVNLSGKVVNADSSGKSGVTVALSGTSLVATTDANGTWSMATNAVVHFRRQEGISIESHLVLEDGRLSVRFQTHDISGRQSLASLKGLGASIQGANGAARQTAAVRPDTLVYSFNGKVFLRDTITNLGTTGIVRMYDTTWNAAVIYGYLSDIRDGQIYRTVSISGKVWMAQNLNFKVDSSWCYVDSAINCRKYGRLYTWSAVMGLKKACDTTSCASRVTGRVSGICPSGWHVPSDAEMVSLMDTIRWDAGSMLRSTPDWYLSTSSKDVYGFRALPAGQRYGDAVGIPGNGTFGILHRIAEFWTASEYSDMSAWRMHINYNDGYSAEDKVYHTSFWKTFGLSLRCTLD